MSLYLPRSDFEQASSLETRTKHRDSTFILRVARIKGKIAVKTSQSLGKNTLKIPTTIASTNATEQSILVWIVVWLHIQTPFPVEWANSNKQNRLTSSVGISRRPAGTDFNTKKTTNNHHSCPKTNPYPSGLSYTVSWMLWYNFQSTGRIQNTGTRLISR